MCAPVACVCECACVCAHVCACVCVCTCSLVYVLWRSLCFTQGEVQREEWTTSETQTDHEM